MSNEQTNAKEWKGKEREINHKHQTRKGGDSAQCTIETKRNTIKVNINMNYFIMYGLMLLVYCVLCTVCLVLDSIIQLTLFKRCTRYQHYMHMYASRQVSWFFNYFNLSHRRVTMTIQKHKIFSFSFIDMHDKYYDISPCWDWFLKC